MEPRIGFDCMTKTTSHFLHRNRTTPCSILRNPYRSSNLLLAFASSYSQYEIKNGYADEN